MNYQQVPSGPQLGNEMAIQNYEVQYDEEDENVVDAAQISTKTHYKRYPADGNHQKLHFQDMLNHLERIKNMVNDLEIERELRILGASLITLDAYKGQLTTKNNNSVINPDNAGSLPIFYAARLKNYEMFFYLWKRGDQETLYYNYEDKNIIHYVIDNDDVFLFRFLINYKYYVQAHNYGILVYILRLQQDAVLCYKDYIDRFSPYTPLKTTKNFQNKIQQYKISQRFTSKCNPMIQCHSKDSTPQTTFLCLIILIVSLVYFVLSPIYLEDDQSNMILDLSIVMLLMYWMFNQTWFINQSYRTDSIQRGGKQIPNDSFLIQTFDEFTTSEQFNRYTIKSTVIGILLDDQIFIEQQIKKHGFTIIDQEIHADDINAIDAINYLVEENQIETLSKIDFDRVCPSCQKFKNHGTKHCSICKQCIKNYSHHSLFYNRCINESNHLGYLIVITNQTLVLLLYIIRFLIFYSNQKQQMYQYMIMFMNSLVSIWNKENAIGLILNSTVVVGFVYSGYQFLVQLRALLKGLTVNELNNMTRYKYIDDLKSPNSWMTNVILYLSHTLREAKIK